MRKLSVAFLFCLTSTIANAQIVPEVATLNKAVVCARADIILKWLADDELNEKPIWIGQDEIDKSEFILFVNSKTKAFTIVQFSKTVGCVLGIGYKSNFVSDPRIKLYFE